LAPGETLYKKGRVWMLIMKKRRAGTSPRLILCTGDTLGTPLQAAAALFPWALAPIVQRMYDLTQE
jgi:hypothetical protein